MSLAPTNAVRVAVRVTGLVQGVGFRPFVHRAATELGLAGWVRNDAAGVEIEVEGPEAAVDAFVAQVTEHPPAMARPRTVAVEARAVVGVDGFRIQPSGSTETVDTYVAPDAAVCDDCVQELFDPSDRRHRYPFITCTNCGPRFTITTALPYDRP
ncbi:MAG: acylphosphatase, partial [Acidimicrobiia bacterium]